MPVLLPAQDVFALASRWEAEGIVLPEAMDAVVLRSCPAAPRSFSCSRAMRKLGPEA